MENIKLLLKSRTIQIIIALAAISMFVVSASAPQGYGG